MACAESGVLPAEPESIHKDTVKDAMGIFAFTALRTREGIDLERFKERFGTDLFEAFEGMEDLAESWDEAGLAEIVSGHFRLTEKGIDRSNDIMSEFV